MTKKQSKKSVNNIDNLLNKIKKAQEKFQSEAKKMLHESFSEFFKNHPYIAECNWSQYTPYFNDGNECVFSVNEVTFSPDLSTENGFAEDFKNKLRESKDDYYYSEDDVLKALKYFTGANVYAQQYKVRDATQQELELMNDMEQLQKLIYGLDRMMKDIFGDHVMVRARRAGFDVEEYDHE